MSSLSPSQVARGVSQGPGDDGRHYLPHSCISKHNVLLHFKKKKSTMLVAVHRNSANILVVAGL